jgi:hypothetical protein
LDNRPIRVTMFWTDEDALVQDFRSGHTRKMMEWANKFFARWKFELEIQPDPNGKIADAIPYCLVKSDGYNPDYASWEEVIKRWMNARLKHFVPWLKLNKRIGELRDDEDAKRPLVDAARQALNALPANDPARPAAQTKLDNLLIEYIEITQEISDKRKEWEQVDKDLDAFDLTFLVEKEERDFQKKPRLQLGQKIIEAFPASAITRIKSKSENPYIFATDRLKILNARFQMSPSTMKMRASKDDHPFGVTIPPINFNRLNGKYLWEGEFIMINLLRFEQITLAHEIVHAAGRGHRQQMIRHARIPDWIRSIQMDAAGKLILPTIYEYEPATGYTDGPPNDILNYNAKAKKAEEVEMQSADATRLAESDFVKIPPPPFTGPIVLPT